MGRLRGCAREEDRARFGMTRISVSPVHRVNAHVLWSRNARDLCLNEYAVYFMHHMRPLNRRETHGTRNFRHHPICPRAVSDRATEIGGDQPRGLFTLNQEPCPVAAFPALFYGFSGEQRCVPFDASASWRRPLSMTPPDLRCAGFQRCYVHGLGDHLGPACSRRRATSWRTSPTASSTSGRCYLTARR